MKKFLTTAVFLLAVINVFSQNQSWYSYFSHSFVRDISTDNSYVYTAFNEGIARYNQSTGVIRHFNKFNTKMPVNDVYSVQSDGVSGFWASAQNLIHFTPKDGLTVYEIGKNNALSSYVLEVDFQDNGTVWYGHFTNDTLGILTNGVFSKKTLNSGVQEIASNKSDVFVGTVDSGLWHYDGLVWKNYHIGNSDLAHNKIRNLAIDNEGRAIFHGQNNRTQYLENGIVKTFTNSLSYGLSAGFDGITVTDSGFVYLIGINQTKTLKYKAGDTSIVDLFDLERVSNAVLASSGNTIYKGIDFLDSKFEVYEAGTTKPLNFGNSELPNGNCKSVEINPYFKELGSSFIENVLFATSNLSGLHLVYKENDSVKDTFFRTKEFFGQDFNVIEGLHFSSDTSIYFATTNDIIKFDLTDFSFQVYNSTNSGIADFQTLFRFAIYDTLIGIGYGNTTRLHNLNDNFNTVFISSSSLFNSDLDFDDKGNFYFIESNINVGVKFVRPGSFTEIDVHKGNSALKTNNLIAISANNQGLYIINKDTLYLLDVKEDTFYVYYEFENSIDLNPELNQFKQIESTNVSSPVDSAPFTLENVAIYYQLSLDFQFFNDTGEVYNTTIFDNTDFYLLSDMAIDTLGTLASNLPFDFNSSKTDLEEHEGLLILATNRGLLFNTGTVQIEDVLAFVKENEVTKDLSVYPNPIHFNELQFELNNNIKGPIQFDIINLNGQLLESYSKASLSKGERIAFNTNLTVGTYVLRVTSQDQNSAAQFVVE